MSDIGASDDTQDSGSYDPSAPISVLGNLPSQWSVAGDDADAAILPGHAPGQPSIFGGAFNPKPWSLADSSLNFFVDPETMKAIDFDGTAPPQTPPWFNASNGATDGQSQPPQPDASGVTGLTPWQPDPTLSGARPVSDEGLDFIKRHELDPHTGKVSLEIKPDDYGNQTFGYGHFVPSDAQAGLQAQLDAAKTTDQKQALADTYFASDIGRAQANVYNRLGSQGVVSLSQPQYDALVADSFNAGGAPALGPKMAQDIKNGDLDAAGRQFNAYWARNARTGEWTTPPGLVGRSLQQAQLFNNGDYIYVPQRGDIDAIMANPGSKPRR